MPSTATTKYDVASGSSEQVLFQAPGNLHPSLHYIYTPAYNKRYEEIWPKQEGNTRNQDNNFEHYKVSSGDVVLASRLGVTLQNVWGGPDYLTVVGFPSTAYSCYGSTQFGPPGLLNNGLPVMYVKRADGGFVPPLVDLDQRLISALSNILPKIKPELSIVNSILELKDFASLPATITRISRLPTLIKLKGLTKLIKDPGRALSGFTGPLREWFKTGADSYLQAQFNIGPLLSDIASLRKALLRTERRVNDFITRSGRTQRGHFTLSLGEMHSTYDTTVASPGYTADGYEMGGEVDLERFSYPDNTTFHVEVEYNFNYTRYQIEHARIFALLDAVGINFNPTIIWNAIPWSFVVDWVIGVGRWLNQQRLGLMDPVINISRCIWSVKRKRVIVVQRSSKWNYYSPGDGRISIVTSPTVPLPVVTETAYRRQLFSPSIGSIRLSGLTDEQYTLGAALVIARHSTYRRRTSWV
jgi:hypothetical protein